jgi:hypothetical protein
MAIFRRDLTQVPRDDTPIVRPEPYIPPGSLPTDPTYTQPAPLPAPIGTTPGGPVVNREGQPPPSSTTQSLAYNFDTNGYAQPGWVPESWGGVLEGWDATKWGDANYWSPKYAIGRLMSMYDTRSPEFMQAVQRMYPSATLNGDRLTLWPGDQPVDIFFDQEGARRPQWLTNDPNAAPTQQQSTSGTNMPMGGGATTAGAHTGVGGYTPPTSPPASALTNAYREAIAKLLNTPQTVDPQTLYNSPENSAFRLSAQRSEERQREQLAERAAADGYSGSGGFESGLSSLRQNRGEAESQFLGQLAMAQMMRNREDLQFGIQTAMADGQFEAAQALQKQLAELDASLRRMALEQDMNQFNLSLGFNYAQLEALLNQRATEALLGG